MRDTEKISFDDFSFHSKMYTYLFDLPTLFAYLECQFCFPFFLIFHVFHTLNAIHSYREKYPFYAFLRSHMVYRSQWKWPPPGHQHIGVPPANSQGGTQLSFWYRGQMGA